MQIILNDAEAKQYLRLKAAFNADVKLISFERQIKYFYNVYLVPVQERVDLESYPDTPKATEEDLERLMKVHVESLLDIVSDLRKELKANQDSNKE